MVAKSRKKCRGSPCLFNPLGFAMTCLSCPLYDGDEDRQEIYVINPDADGVVPCPYYGGDCLVMTGTGAIGEWCMDCAHTDPENVFKPQQQAVKRHRKAKERKQWDHGRYCESCGSYFYAEQEHQRFCSTKCRKREKMRRYFKRKREQKIALRQANGTR